MPPLATGACTAAPVSQTLASITAPDRQQQRKQSSQFLELRHPFRIGLQGSVERNRSMRHSMPIVTPRLVLRPPTLADLDSIQTAKEDAWPDLQLWMAWAFDNERSRQAMENSIRRTMDYQDQAGIALAGFHKINGDFVVRTALDFTDEPNVFETGYWVAPKYAGQGMATEAANAAIRYAFGHLGAKAISIGYFDGNEASRRIVDKLGFQKLGVARQAATRCLDGTKLDRHEYILTGPDALPELHVSWG
ncbi:MAG: GNAT family protein [Bryobacteraceae bacterium]